MDGWLFPQLVPLVIVKINDQAELVLLVDKTTYMRQPNLRYLRISQFLDRSLVKLSEISFVVLLKSSSDKREISFCRKYL